MEKYVDLITNGLDLISFLLVTRELVRLTAPAMRYSIRIITFFLVGLAGLIVPFLLVGLVFYLFGRDPPAWLLVQAIVWGGPIAFGLAALLNLSGWLERYASKHFLALGVVLFFISRLIAFYGATLKAMAHPCASACVSG
jgi:hypothetical protein